LLPAHQIQVTFSKTSTCSQLTNTSSNIEPQSLFYSQFRFQPFNMSDAAPALLVILITILRKFAPASSLHRISLLLAKFQLLSY
jgi:hypothetical protein